jgi:tetratricopeptide (TPR) repeat protein
MPASAAERDRRLQAVRIRLDNASGHPRAVLDPAAIGDVDALLASVAAAEADLEVLALAGCLYWARAGLATPASRFDLDIALTLLHPCYAADPASVPADARERLATFAASDAALCNCLGAFVFRYAQHARNAGTLDQAIRLLERGTAGDLPGAPGLAEALANLGAAWRQRYQLNRHEADFSQAIAAQRRAVKTAGPQHPRRPPMSDTLVQMLMEQYAGTEDVKLLDEAMAETLLTLSTTRSEDPARSRRTYDLASQYGYRYRREERQGDFDEALRRARKALTLAKAAGDGQVRFLSLGLIEALHGTRYARLGHLGDLEESIAAVGDARRLVPVGSPLHASVTSDLGLALRLRYERFGDTTDLNGSVNLAQEAAHAAREAQRQRPGSVRLPELLANLASVLCVRYELGHDPDDAKAAVQASRDSVAALDPPDHPSRPGCLGNLGRALGCRYDATGQVADLAEEVSVLREAVERTDEGRPERGDRLANLGSALAVLGARTRDARVLAEAVGFHRAALKVTAEDDPVRAQRLYNLAMARRSQWELGADESAAVEALGHFRAAAGVTIAATSTRIQAAAAAGQLAAQRGTFALAAESFGLAVGLLPQLASRRLSRGDAQRWLAEFRGLASQAASCAVRAGDVAMALTLFETGRGVLLSQALDLGGELAELEQADPDAARRLERLRAELNGVTSDPREDPAGLAERRRRAAAELDDLIADVRAMPGLAGFMLPPSAAELLEAASDGAVVLVNASPWGCQAIALHDGELTPIPLDALDADEAARQAGALTQAMTVIQDPGSGWGERNQAEATMLEILGWLWDVVGQPVLHALGHDQMPAAGRPWPRVWWVTSGPLSVFPLASAGRYDAGLGHAVTDRVVSSAVPTVRALLRIRSAHRDPAVAERLLVVAMPHTADASDLPGAADEADLLARRFPHSVVLVDEQATLERVRAELATATRVHFACHGVSDVQVPENSALLLSDHAAHPMTVTELARTQLPAAAFAFLSACSTGAGIPPLADEFVHVTGGCLLAGFGSVVGTLWQIDDDTPLQIADIVYAEVEDRGLACVPQTLQEALASIRVLHPGQPSRWAAHIHVGA